jgi:hypothetical protein
MMMRFYFELLKAPITEWEYKYVSPFIQQLEDEIFNDEVITTNNEEELEAF